MRSLRAILGIIAVAALGGALIGVNASTAQGTGTIRGELNGHKRYQKGSVVYLAKVPGQHRPPSRPAVMDQKNLKFIPQVLPVVKGTKVVFRNSDPTAHNVFTPDGSGYDLGSFPEGEARARVFKKVGVYTQLCRLHPSMLAHIIVFQNPFFDKTSSGGSFKIDNVPPGTYTLKAWHERGHGKPTKVTVEAGSTTEVQVRMKRK